jgi:hypothetical protein
VIVKEDGETIFDPDRKGLHVHLQLDAVNVPRLQELFATLVSEPPQV